jgi:replication-associated recombination protein RarA
MDLQDDLLSMPGMDAVRPVVNAAVNNAMHNKLRVAAGLEPEETNYNFVLSGNPGTGKTTVIRKLGRLYYELGLTHSPEVAQLTRAQLVGPWSNRVAQNTHDVITANRGKLIFIDEAYSLVKGPQDKEGREAADELMRLTEEYRGDTAFGLAAYDIKALFDSNPGYESRFRRQMTLKDYTPADKVRVMDYMLAENNRGFLNTKARRVAARYVAELPSAGDKGNARAVRNFYDGMREAQAQRLVEEFASRPGDITEKAFATFTEADVELAAAHAGLPRPKSGKRVKTVASEPADNRRGYSARRALRPVSHAGVAV